MINRFTTVAGNTIFVRLAASCEMEKGKKRGKKENPTSVAVAEHNQKKAERDLALLLNYNFCGGDLHIVLTYAGAEPTQEEAKRSLSNFLKRLRRHYRKIGAELKWICVTEFEHARIHHHIVINQGAPVETVAQIWGKGLVRSTPLDPSGDYRRLASYLIKETSKTFRRDDVAQRQRYSCSKTIRHPVTKREPVSAAALIRDPQPVKGYYIDQDSIYKSSNPVTGQPCMEYVMVSLAAAPRLTTWPRGRKIDNIAGDRWLRIKERQMQLELEPEKRVFCDMQKGMR